jgi:hypothetical protein
MWPIVASLRRAELALYAAASDSVHSGLERSMLNKLGSLVRAQCRPPGEALESGLFSWPRTVEGLRPAKYQRGISIQAPES